MVGRSVGLLIVFFGAVLGARTAPVITSQPSNQSVTFKTGETQNATFMVVASGSPAPTYQWQTFPSGGASWSNLTATGPYSGVTSDTLTVVVSSTALNGAQFRCVITNTDGSVTSSAATLTTIFASPPVPWLDAPTGTVTIGANGGIISGQGWAFACGSTISSYVFSIDSVTVNATLTKEIARPDVQAYYQTHGCPTASLNTGFTFTIAGADVTTGSHVVGLVVTDSLGRQVPFSRNFSLRKSVPGFAWTRVASLPVPLYDVDAVAASDRIYLVGGRDTAGCAVGEVRAYDAQTNVWSTATLLPTPRAEVNAMVINGVIYAAGGSSGCSGTTAQSSLVLEAYATANNSWSTLAPLPERGYVGAMGSLIYLVSLSVQSAYTYDPGTNQWSAIPAPGSSTVHKRQAHGVGSTLYLLGGVQTVCFSLCGISGGVLGYAGSWTNKSSMPTGRVDFGVADLDGRLHVVGGFTNLSSGFSTPTGAAEAFDPVSNQWFTYPSLPTARTYLAAAALNGVLYAIGGRDASTSPSTPTTEVNALVPVADAQMNLDEPSSGSGVSTTFTIRGWAVDLGAQAGSGVDDVHVYAFPLAGGSLGSPIFLGNTYGASRPDVGAVFGSPFNNSGFSLEASLLPGSYRIGAYVWSARLSRFIASQFADITVAAPVSQPLMFLDTPPAVAQRGRTFKIDGWAIDRAVAPGGGVGVDVVHVWAFPAGGGSPTFVAAIPTGLTRLDVGAVFGARFTASGYEMESGPLSPGQYRLVAYAHSTVTGTFNNSQGADITVLAPVPLMAVDVPNAASGPLSGQFGVRGWAADLRASSGSGVDALHVWAFDVSTGTATFVGAGTLGGSRPDVGDIFGSQFNGSGFTLTAGPLPAGTYDLAVYARSAGSATFNQHSVVRITVQ